MGRSLPSGSPKDLRAGKKLGAGGYLDVTAYRDDKRSGTSGEDKTDLPFPIEGKQIILVDDVIYTGRTVRACLFRQLLKQNMKKTLYFLITKVYNLKSIFFEHFYNNSRN